MLVDVHAHLDDPAFRADIELVVRRAEEAGVKTIINNGINPESNRKTLDLAKMFGSVKPALGIFPTYAAKMSSSQLKKELFFIAKSRPFAIGEVGLDLHHLDSLEKQEPAFRKFIELSISMDIPIIVHSRKAEKETISILEDCGAEKVVLHCFSGKASLAKECEKKGWYLSIPALAKNSSHFKSIIKSVSITRLLTETDSPYLSPVRGARNEPAMVGDAVKTIAEIKGIESGEAERNIFFNFQRLFST